MDTKGDQATEGNGEEDARSKEEVKIVRDVDDETQEHHRPRILPDPGRPTAQQREIHECIHIPFRAWCRECVLGRGRDRQHRRIDDNSGIPRISMDYMFLTEYGIARSLDEAETLISSNGGAVRTCMTVMVLKDFRSKSVWAYPVEGKGVSAAEWLITQILEDLDTCGLDGCRIVLKSDQEPSIVEVQNKIAELRRQAHSHGTIIENSKVGDSNSNARIERAIQELGGLVRT